MNQCDREFMHFRVINQRQQLVFVKTICTLEFIQKHPYHLPHIIPHPARKRKEKIRPQADFFA